MTYLVKLSCEVALNEDCDFGAQNMHAVNLLMWWMWSCTYVADVDHHG